MCKNLLLCLSLVQVSVFAREPVARLHELPFDSLFTVTNGRIEVEGPVFRWTIPSGQTSTLELSQACPVIQRLRYHDRLLFDYRIVSGRVQFLFNVNAFGIRPGPRQGKMHQWHIGLPTTAAGRWYPTQVEFDIPAWLPWDSRDGLKHGAMLNLEVGAATEDLVIELRDMRLTPDAVTVKPWWLTPVSFPQRKGDTYQVEYQVINLGPGKRTVKAEVRSAHKAFEVRVEPAEIEMSPFKGETFRVTAKLPTSELPELYKEDMLVAFVPQDQPEAAYLASAWLVRPLTPGYRKQVVYSQDELKLLKASLAREEVRKWLRLDQRTKHADWFLDVKLGGVPGTRAWAHNGYRGDVCPREGCGGIMACGTTMPEAECRKCGRFEVGTGKAAIVWKLWMGSSTSGEGGLDDLGTVYLLTGDEKYARKAIDLLLLYAEQYQDLPWTEMQNDLPYFRGNHLLGESRIAHCSTYGSNFLLKGHFRLLNLVSESPSWTDEARQKVYEGFALPAAAELAKFPGGLFNMTDITNFDLILAGLSCNDANILYRGLAHDSGLLKRLTDIKPDGFSSEGRPLNYHYAAMREYASSVPMVKNSGLSLDAPYGLLKAAVRMPYERATLSGFVPASGDCGCGSGVGPNPLCDVVYDLFPDEGWLYEAGARSTLRTFLRSLDKGAPAPDAWRSILKTAPTLFRDAGLAILRSGTKPEEQVYATLDFGENPMHAALDRLQITLWAYGKIFVQGPGSSYNAATNYKRGPKEALAFIGHDSLSNNVVMVDTADQAPAIGRLIAWVPEATSGAGVCQAVAAEVEGHYPGVVHRRALYLIRNVLVVLDDLCSEKTHTYDFVYHNFGTLEPGPDWAATAHPTPLGDQANYASIRSLQRLSGKGDLRLKWTLSDGLSLEFWQAASGDDAYLGLTGLNNADTCIVGDDAPSVFVRAAGKTQRFATVLQPLKGESGVASIDCVDGKAETGVVLRFKDGRAAKLLFRPGRAEKDAIAVE